MLADPIEQHKELRRSFLRAIYERADGSPTEFVYWRDLAPKFGFADTKEPPSPIMAALDQLEGLGFITIEVDEGTVYRITTAGINEVEDSLPADLVGQLYDPFDTQDPAGTIPAVVSKWISDKGLA